MDDIRDEKMALYRFPPLHIVAFVVFRGLETRQWTGFANGKVHDSEADAPGRHAEVSPWPILVPTWQAKPPFPGKPLPG